ncbi:MAG: glutamine synthetase III [Oscillospiraceae bacterium]|nr:glutamine synthetase III [Oscillospiraceae bacterium]
MTAIPEYFGSLVFDDRVMKARLSNNVYQSLNQTIREGNRLDPTLADAVADAMRDWAVEKGATHFTHWFQPLTDITAEKHDSFISPSPDGGVIMEFSGKELIQGEPDASSFPSGGLRATFEARGYTAWDPTSYAFIKDKVLCIPTAFCAYGGEALDQKTPLLRSMEALNKQAMRILKLFGNTDVRHVTTYVGPEQEYFLVDKELYKMRPDLIYTGRTLFGAQPPKGQELDDHYFGSIKPRVQAFMDDLNVELWKHGIFAKTEHNEVAPAQHELATIYTTANLATDHNQLTMELMQKTASKHGLVCLLHEKPFDGINGSGKHNNWSIATDTGVNLLSPGDTPYENAQFLLFLMAVVEAVDEYQDILRLSVASAANDCRLGGNEAPPAIVSVFLGDELTAILSAIETDTAFSAHEKSVVRLGVHALPRFPRDMTDRNRTSPFAFTGNKFEFRMVGSSQSIALANTVLNTAVAESLRKYADRLEGSEDFNTDMHSVIKDAIASHKRIIFNGNGYGDAWLEEAVKVRHLAALSSAPECFPRLISDRSIDLFTKHRVFSELELRSRYEIMFENYTKTVVIEAKTMSEMASRMILPAVEQYAMEVSDTALSKRELISGLECRHEQKLVAKLSLLADSISECIDDLDGELVSLGEVCGSMEKAMYVKDTILRKMAELRKACDDSEKLVPADMWPFPTYGELLFSVDDDRRETECAL